MQDMGIFMVDELPHPIRIMPQFFHCIRRIWVEVNFVDIDDACPAIGRIEMVFDSDVRFFFGYRSKDRCQNSMRFFGNGDSASGKSLS